MRNLPTPLPVVKAILLMGGSGERFKSNLPKQFHRIGGKKIYLHTLERFLKIELFDEILLVCPESWMESVQEDLKEFKRKNIRLVIGGATRQESSRLGLLACGNDTDFVLIHDAVRPFVSERILRENISYAIRYGAVDTCIPSADTLVHSVDGNVIREIPRRSEYLRGQTPQSFSYKLILRAHEQGLKEKRVVSDDCSLVQFLGKEIHIVLGEEENIKITSELDLFLGEQLLRHAGVLAPSLSNHPIGSLQGKKIAVTGGTGGIGQAIVSRLKEAGATAFILARSSPDFPVDLTRFSEAEKVFESLHQLHGPLDGLINCIGKLKRRSIADLTGEEIQELIAVNLTSVAFVCKCAKIKEGGHLINIASSSYSRGRKEFALYSAAKAAVVNFSQALAEERPDLRVHTLAPQRTNTSARRMEFPGEDPLSLLSPDKVAEEALSLLSMNGQLTGSLVEIRN